MSESTVVKVTPENWQREVMEAEGLVLADFWAEWCGPCKAIAPVLNEVAAELAGKLKVAKVDVDQNQALAAEFGIRSVPTLLVIKGGAVQAQMVGAMNKATLMDKLAAYL